jgi:hypothetical protein
MMEQNSFCTLTCIFMVRTENTLLLYWVGLPNCFAASRGLHISSCVNTKALWLFIYTPLVCSSFTLTLAVTFHISTEVLQFCSSTLIFPCLLPTLQPIKPKCLTYCRRFSSKTVFTLYFFKMLLTVSLKAQKGHLLSLSHDISQPWRYMAVYRSV